ncbi:DUF4331 domain-containing protein [Allobranchiibius sp. GilTou73]|uniref:DUF4331 domain-containing protein n=1 Tax=Allobranchiibius sp. GilTou73 TaxID=2904523 RepID=UPI001F1CC793|nr:DUF4331 domain-containing protein [Allobranchiibius sp. GilTou73]UIJ33708.1 DUF4331 domain-containing protein [Allobranchiibius sp. GilTou73]
MSSHKEAPSISNDAAADNTDVYVFVSPDNPDTVTMISNFVPFEDPAGGPNFYEFGDDVLYEIHIDNNGDGLAEIVYQFTFNTDYTLPNTFLYNIGPIESLTSKNWNRRQYVSVNRRDVTTGKNLRLADKLPCPPCNIGPFSTPDYVKLANAAIHHLDGGRTLFAGQRAEGFYVDLGAIFDLGDLRPFQNLHVGSQMPAAGGISGTNAKNVHSITLQVPKTDLSAGGHAPTDPTNPRSTIGVWATASRQQTRMYDTDRPGTTINTGPWVQVSRQANPLFNEVLIPITKKDLFNSQQPGNDKQFAQYVTSPELGKLLPSLYPGEFPRLAALNASGKPRADLAAILLTGIPAGIVPGFQNNTGTVMADQLRLNMAIPPTTKSPSNLGLIGMDPAGFPNGRRVFDDVTTIELRAIAGVTYALVDKSFTPDKAAGAITQGLTSSNTDVHAKNTQHYLPGFPYLGTPHNGHDNPANNDPAPYPGTSAGPTVPIGGPSTGAGGTSGGRDTGLLVGGAVAAAGAAAAAVAHQHRSGNDITPETPA